MNINNAMTEQTIQSILDYLQELEWLEVSNEPAKIIKLKVLPERKEQSIELTISVESVRFESYPQTIQALLASNTPQENRLSGHQAALLNFFRRLSRFPRAVFSLSVHRRKAPNKAENIQGIQVNRERII